MLRRLSTIRPAVVSAAPLSRSFATTRPAYYPPKSEEEQELERERLLREQFARKMGGGQAGSSQQQQPTSGGSAFSGTSQTPPGGNPWGGANLTAEQQAFMRRYFMRRGGQGSQETFFQRVLRYTMYFWGAYALLLLFAFNKEGSPLNALQGIPYWALPVTDTACYMLVRLFVGFRQQLMIRQEFETRRTQEPGLSFATFLSQTHPTIFNGNRHSQAEVVAAMSAAAASTNDTAWAEAAVRAAAPHRGNIPASVDAIVDTLKSTYPQAFSGMSQAYQPPPGSAYPTGQPSGSPSYSFGGNQEAGYQQPTGGMSGTQPFGSQSLGTTPNFGGGQNYGTTPSFGGGQQQMPSNFGSGTASPSQFYHQNFAPGESQEVYTDPMQPQQYNNVPGDRGSHGTVVRM